MTARDTFVYRVLDNEGSPLYIGCTRNPEQRWRHHQATKPALAALAARFRMNGPYPRDTALAIERERIATEGPPFNALRDKCAQPNGAEVRAEMGRQRVSMVALAARTNIARTTLAYQINSGRLTVETLRAIAKALDVPLSALVSDEDVAS